MTLSFTANRPVEHPGGLRAAATGSRVGSPVRPFARVAANPALPGTPTSITWRTPGIFNQIALAGQTVVSVSVVIVPADNGGLAYLAGIDPSWTDSGINIQTGQQVWVDTQSVGAWGWFPGGPVQSTANGGAPSIVTLAMFTTKPFPTNYSVPEPHYCISTHHPFFSLLGFVGSNPYTPAPVEEHGTRSTARICSWLVIP